MPAADPRRGRRHYRRHAGQFWHAGGRGRQRAARHGDHQRDRGDLEGDLGHADHRCRQRTLAAAVGTTGGTLDNFGTLEAEGANALHGMAITNETGATLKATSGTLTIDAGSGPSPRPSALPAARWTILARWRPRAPTRCTAWRSPTRPGRP